MKAKKILFAHSGGSQDGPGEGSFDLVASLKESFANEFEVHFPLIDEPDAPTYKMWKKLFANELKKIDLPAILIGHSLGGSMLLKYLSEEQPKISIAAIFLVSIPQWGEGGWEVDDFVLPENFASKLGSIGKVFLYQSDEDDIVPFEHMDFYKLAFPKAVVRVLNGKDHVFARGLPELVEDIRALSETIR